MRKPTGSPWSIICTDNVCWGIFTIGPAVLFFALAIAISGTVPGGRGKPDIPIEPGTATLVLAGAAVLILFLAAIVAWRVARVRRVFEEGREVEATVRTVKRFRGGSKLKLEFQLDGILYTASSTFQRWPKTPSFTEGARIRVLVDPTNPKCAVPRALYDDTSPIRNDDPPTPADNRSWVLKLKNRA